MEERNSILQKVMNDEKYNVVFEILPAEGCFRSHKKDIGSPVEGGTDTIVNVEDAKKLWIPRVVHRDDRAYVLDLFDRIMTGEDVAFARYRCVTDIYIVYYIAEFFRTDEGTVLVCLSEWVRESNRDALSNLITFDNYAKEFAKPSNGTALGVFVYIRDEETIFPIDISRSICERFRINKEQLLAYRFTGVTLRDVGTVDWIAGDYIEDFIFGDIDVCNVNITDEEGRKAGYSLKKAVTVLEDGKEVINASAVPIKEKIYVRTFGVFGVFIHDKPVIFSSPKVKEMLAVLVDHRGSFVSNAEMNELLWPEEPVDERVMNRCRKTATYLKNDLRKYGIEDIVESVRGQRRIIPENITCDLYEYLEGSDVEASLRGMYMHRYSWGMYTQMELK